MRHETANVLIASEEFLGDSPVGVHVGNNQDGCEVEAPRQFVALLHVWVLHDSGSESRHGRPLVAFQDRQIQHRQGAPYLSRIDLRDGAPQDASSPVSGQTALHCRARQAHRLAEIVQRPIGVFLEKTQQVAPLVVEFESIHCARIMRERA